MRFQRGGGRGGGDRGSRPPPGKSQVIWVSMGNKQLDPPGTLKNDDNDLWNWPFDFCKISCGLKKQKMSELFIPRHTLVSGYYVIPFGVCPSVRAHHFRSITWVFIHGIFSNFAYILLSAMSGMGLLMGKIRPFLTELLPFFLLEKWFLACYSFTVHDIWMKLHRYVAHQRLHIVTKDRHSDLPSLWVIRPW